jgi:hypothetical protein
MKCRTLSTWGGGKQFCYEGSVSTGTTIRYGKELRWTATISASDYQRILQYFSKSDVAVGTSKDTPPPGSVGEWVKANVNKSGLMSYIGAILVQEGYAAKPGVGRIRFF